MYGNNTNGDPPFRWGVELTPEIPVSDVVDLATAAEANGFGAVFGSSHYNNRDPLLALARIAAQTEAIRLGPGVVNPYETHPVRLASQLATLDEMSGGRAILGLGAGDRSTLTNLGIDRDRPLRTVLETMQVSRRIWSGEQVTHDGTFVAKDAGLNYETQPMPVFVGGQGPHMLRMAAKHADGVLVNASNPRDYEWATDQLAIGLEDRSEDKGPFTVAGFASVSIAEDEGAAITEARRPVSYIAGGAAEEVLERHDLDVELAAEIGAAISAGERERAYDLVTPAMLDTFCIVGTPESVAERIENLFDYVDAFVAASPLGPDRATAIELLGDVRTSVEATIQ